MRTFDERELLNALPPDPFMFFFLAQISTDWVLYAGHCFPPPSYIWVVTLRFPLGLTMEKKRRGNGGKETRRNGNRRYVQLRGKKHLPLPPATFVLFSVAPELPGHLFFGPKVWKVEIFLSFDLKVRKEADALAQNCQKRRGFACIVCNRSAFGTTKVLEHVARAASAKHSSGQLRASGTRSGLESVTFKRLESLLSDLKQSSLIRLESVLIRLESV